MEKKHFTQKDVDKIIGHGAELKLTDEYAFVKVETVEGFEDRVMALPLPLEMREQLKRAQNDLDSVNLFKDSNDGPDAKRHRAVLLKFFRSEARLSEDKEKQLRIEIQERQKYKAALEKVINLVSVGPYVLSRNDATRMHQFLEAQPWKKAYQEDEGYINVNEYAQYKEYESFLIQHNWARVFHYTKQSEEVTEDQIVLPFEKTAFEYVINGVTVIHFMNAVVCDVGVSGDKREKLLHVGFGYGGVWFVLAVTETGYRKFFDYLHNLTDRVLLAMDSEIAVADIVVAPAKLNKKRLESGKLPINEYRIIKIRPRKKQDAHVASEYQGIRRLHVRRGHWRRFQDGHKTWIKSMLVGNPDLGFIDHDYAIGM